MTDSARKSVEAGKRDVLETKRDRRLWRATRSLRHSQADKELRTMPFERDIRADSARDKSNENRTSDNWKPLGDLIRQAVADATRKREGSK